MDDIKENMNYSVLYHNNTALCTSESYGQVLVIACMVYASLLQTKALKYGT